MNEKLINKLEDRIEKFLQEDENLANIEYLYKLVKTNHIAKEDKNMNYGNYNGYGNYGNYGNYGRDAYGRRGYDAKYRGEGALEAMHGNYRAYSAGRESYNAGNYGARDDAMKSLRYMLESAVDFFKMLKAEANSQEEITLIHDYVSKINEM